MVGVELQNLSKQFPLSGQSFEALKNVCASIAPGSFTVITGKSGCGKTTLLRLVGGLEEKTSGRIIWTGANMGQSVPKIGFVFQEPRLMPWLTVSENLAFSLINEKDSIVTEKTVESALSLLGLETFRHAYPSQLSGGMAQRVALGRTLCYDPDLILMDEPFGALDFFTRKKLQREMVELFLTQQKTILFVTHDVPEAIYLGQKILVMEAGEVVREIPIDMPYPREASAQDFLQLQQEILDSLGGL